MEKRYGMRTARIKDVAALAGVSVGSVSNVLNPHKRVTPDVEQRVLAAIKQLGFVRNDAARQLRAGRSRSIGIVVLDSGNPFFTELAHGVEDALERVSRTLLLGSSYGTVERENRYLDQFDEQRIAGLLITPAGPVGERLSLVAQRGCPIVLVDTPDAPPGFSSVSVNDYSGGHLAASHLLSQDRRKVMFVAGALDIAQVHRRYLGAQSAIAETSGASLDVVDFGAMTAEAGQAAAERILAMPESARPDAIFAANDLIALGVLQVFTRTGVRVPDDVALIGYDDIFFASTAAVPLSSIRQPAWEMGRTATELLLEAIESPSIEARSVVFEPELVVRQSTVSVHPAP